MKRKKRKFLVFVMIIIILFVSAYIIIDKRANSLLASTAEAKLRARITGLSNKCVIDSMAENPDFSNLILIENDNSGKVSSVRANSVRMNLLSYKTAEKMQIGLNTLQQQDISINWLALFGSDLFSGMGPSITIKVQPIGSVETAYISEFISAGINQTRHRIYLEVKCSVTVVMPAGDMNMNITSQVVVSECIVVGEVPNSYVYVDETDKMLNLIPN